MCSCFEFEVSLLYSSPSKLSTGLLFIGVVKQTFTSESYFVSICNVITTFFKSKPTNRDMHQVANYVQRKRNYSNSDLVIVSLSAAVEVQAPSNICLAHYSKDRYWVKIWFQRKEIHSLRGWLTRGAGHAEVGYERSYIVFDSTLGATAIYNYILSLNVDSSKPTGRKEGEGEVKKPKAALVICGCAFT